MVAVCDEVHFCSVAQNISRSPQRKRLSEGQAIALRLEDLLAQVPVPDRSPCFEGQVLLIGLLRVEVKPNFNFLGDGPRATTSDAEEGQHEGRDELAPKVAPCAGH